MLVPDERAGRRSLAFVGRIGNPSCRVKSTDCQSVLGAANGFWQMLRPRLCLVASRTRLRARQEWGPCQNLLAHPAADDPLFDETCVDQLR